jgi:hypothetical protein
MTRLAPDPGVDPRYDRAFVERERNRFAGRALLLLVALNGVAALVLLSILARAPEGSVDSRIANAMLFFSGGAVAALLSAFLAYVNRTVRMEAPGREMLRRVLRVLAILAVIGSGAAFLTGMNMVTLASSEKSSSHPKGPKERKSPARSPREQVQLLTESRFILHEAARWKRGGGADESRGL